jgi:ParB family chromosome partitioning protein
MTGKSRGLGRGLSALIPKTEDDTHEVDLDLIVPNPEQPRASFDDATLEELAQSIREHGILQPLVVSAVGESGVYQLVAGERRLRAARLAGLQRVPVVVKEAASRELLEMALVENLQREDLNPLEEAQAYRRLSDEFGLTQEQIATRVGRSRTAVANSVRLLTLSDGVKGRLMSGEITEGHARALLGLESNAAREEAARQIAERGLTVRETERLVRNRPTPKTPRPAPRERDDAEIAALEARLRESLGTKVEIRRGTGGRGRIVCHFYSDEELNALLQRMGLSLGGEPV